MEARLIGTIEESSSNDLLQLLIALSGQVPADVGVHELMLYNTQKPRQTVQISHMWLNETPRNHHNWMAQIYSMLPWGTATLDKIPVTLRSIQRSQCNGPDVIGVFTSLGFAPDYQYIKLGKTVDIHVKKHNVHFTVNKVYKVSTNIDPDADNGANSSTSGENFVPSIGDEVSPGVLVVEAWTTIEDNTAYVDAVAAVAEAAALVSQLVTLQKLPHQQRGTVVR